MQNSGINSQDGVDVLLRSLHYLVNELKEINFVCYIVGDGESLPSVKKLSDELKLNPFVKFPGYIHDRETLNEYFCLADICVEPAPDNEANRHSTFIKIMEYMSVSKPIVAYDLTETRYSAGGSALLIKAGDVNGYAKAIKQLMDSTTLREKLGKRGFKRIKNVLNWEKSKANLKIVYNSVVSQC